MIASGNIKGDYLPDLLVRASGTNWYAYQNVQELSGLHTFNNQGIIYTKASSSSYELVGLGYFWHEPLSGYYADAIMYRTTDGVIRAYEYSSPNILNNLYKTLPKPANSSNPYKWHRFAGPGGYLSGIKTWQLVTTNNLKEVFIGTNWVFTVLGQRVAGPK